MSFWDDASKFGSGLLDDVGEGFGNLMTAATTAPPPDKAANPAVHQQPKQTVSDQHGNAVTKGFGETGGLVQNKTVMIGGIGLAILLILVLLVLAVRK